MEAEGFLYNALSPLSAAAAPSPPPADSEPYVVFRNEISLSTTQPHSPQTATADYFSLDVGADNEEAPADLISTPLASASVTERERTLEGGWFRENCWFKSSLLQLHKDTGFLLTFSHQLQKSKHHGMQQLKAFSELSDRYGPTARYLSPDFETSI